MAAPPGDSSPRRRSDQQALKEARAQGKKDAELDQFRSTTRKHLAAVNGSIARFGDELENLAAEFRVFKNQQSTRDEVNTELAKALAKQGKRRLSVFQGALAVVSVLALIAAVIVPYVH